jgi:hypothetical protein
LSHAQGGNPEVRKIIRQLRPGYTVRGTGRAKLVVVDPAGNVVRKPGTSLPVLLPNSPNVRGYGPAQWRRWLQDAGAIDGGAC